MIVKFKWIIGGFCATRQVYCLPAVGDQVMVSGLYQHDISTQIHQQTKSDYLTVQQITHVFDQDAHGILITLE
jgi:hypothetical protein